MSNFLVRYSDGTLRRVPVVYGDADRQVANIINQNSENLLASAPQISVYISGLSLDRSRLSDPTFVSKMHIREREIIDDEYGPNQGNGFTIERLMPTPFMLTCKVDIWTTNTEQKLQLLEQILMLFNPSLEIQTNDNYVDWTSLSVVDLEELNFSSKTIPAGTSDSIDIATLTIKTPIWISPPVKVKKLGIITKIITNVFNGTGSRDPNYIKGLGTDMSSGSVSMGDLMFTTQTSIGNYTIEVVSNKIRLINYSNNGQTNSWTSFFTMLPGNFIAGISKIYLQQDNGEDVIAMFEPEPTADNLLNVTTWDVDSYPVNTLLTGPSRNNAAWGSFDAIVDPENTGPAALINRSAGMRYLIVNNIGGGIRETFVAEESVNLVNTEIAYDKVKDFKIFVDGTEVNAVSINLSGHFGIQTQTIVLANSIVRFELYLNEQGPIAWKNNDNSDFIADTNDIIEWDGNNWVVVFSAKESVNQIIFQTNLFTNTQYQWNGRHWNETVDGIYHPGQWKIEL